MQPLSSSPKKPAAPPAPRFNPALRFGLTTLLVLGVGFLLGYESKPTPSPSVNQPGTPPLPAGAMANPSPEFLRGREVARAVCVLCHLFPEPAMLDKTAWGLEVLPNMMFWVGGAPFDYENHPGGELVRQAAIMPPAPLIIPQDWRAICTYYLAAAPAALVRSNTIRTALPVTTQFRAITAPYHRDTPMTTLVKIDSPMRKIFVGDAGTGTLEQLNPAGVVERSLKVNGTPVSLTINPRGWHLTLLGDFFASDEPKAKLLRFDPPKAGALTFQTVWDQRPRTTDTVLADLDGDGFEDMVVSHFGNLIGRFSWYQNDGRNEFTEKILLNRPGAIRAYVRDFNGDGRPDIIVLMAQAREGISLFLNQGHGNFEEKVLLEKPPMWGFTDFALADVNHDGFLDIITANGDNGDNMRIPPPVKPYHGIRIYLNDGKNHFSEAFFHPLPGAYKVLVRDFDNDGQLDLAAISFFPDYEHAPGENFVFLKNTSERTSGAALRFKAYGLPESMKGRWVTADAGDVDGDGDIDLVLGSFQQGFSAVPSDIRESWKKEGATLLILLNTLRE